MPSRWKDAAHLIRPAVVFLAGLLLFFLLRGAVVPPSFGRYGHYRAGALDEIRQKPIKFAGKEVCGGCHVDEMATHDKGKHRTVACEACHGPLANHADDPTTVKPVLPDTSVLCARCHEADTAKPAWFKQVVTREHSGGVACNACHQPHSPALN
jgi:uncharacterized CHY-type Zn-finger protein